MNRFDIINRIGKGIASETQKRANLATLKRYKNRW